MPPTDFYIKMIFIFVTIFKRLIDNMKLGENGETVEEKEIVKYFSAFRVATFFPRSRIPRLCVFFIGKNLIFILDCLSVKALVFFCVLFSFLS